MLPRPLSDEEKAQRLPKHEKAVKNMWRIFWGAWVLVVLIFAVLSFSDLPTIEELENPRSELASEVFGANGEVLGRYYVENRVPVTYDQLSPHVVKALVATEDERYYEHCGIDFKALGRVFVKTFLMGQRSSGGASTITQQLAKLLFTEKPASGMERVIQKLKEWIIALRLERRYTKEEILAMYLNKFDFLYDSDGIKAASETYFGKNQKQLNIQEAAVLVGMLKNPSLYNPKSRPESARIRRNVVFQQMERNGVLDQPAVDSLSKLPMDMSNFKRSNHAEGLAPYFRMELAKLLKTDILERQECRKTDGSKYDIYRDGLKIYTTIDPVMQAIAEKVMVQHMTKVQNDFWRTWKNKDPWTYETADSETEIPVEKRKEALVRLMRESDRYVTLRDEIMAPVFSKLSEEIEDVTLSDWEIEQILKEEKEKGSIAKLVANKVIKEDRAAKFRRVMESENWRLVKKNWQTLQTRFEEIFNKPVPMKVFAYNEKMEKDTVMSPLDSIKYHRMFLQLGSMGVDPVTGQVKFWVGGINHKYFQFDHVQTRRQVGSTFKPFIYATAIEFQGISPCMTVFDQPQTISPGDGNFHLIKPWTPKNSTGKYSGASLTLYQGLKKSVNTVSVYLMKLLGDTDPVTEVVSNMGINPKLIPAQPSICLGATDLSVIEMTGAYTTFANNGLFNRPSFILRIEDKNGRIIYQGLPEERQALNPTANYVMLDMLKYAAIGAGGFDGVKSEFGGKTGTTNDYVDGWFMGLTPNLVVGTWVGGEDRWIRFRSLDLGQGARMARPFFAGFLKELEKNPDADYTIDAHFYRPPGDIGIVMNCNEYRQDSEPSENEYEDFTEDPFGDETLIRNTEEAKKKPNPLDEGDEDF